MAKQKMSLKDKLKSERTNRKTTETTPLAKKKVLGSSKKNVEEIENLVKKIHKEETVTPSKPKVVPKPKQEETVRLTVDVPKSMHKKIKIKVAEKELKIQWYLRELITKDLNQ